MKSLSTLLKAKKGQGLVEYTLIVFLVLFVFWFAVRGTSMGDAMGEQLNKVSDCVAAPFAC